MGVCLCADEVLVVVSSGGSGKVVVVMMVRPQASSFGNNGK